MKSIIILLVLLSFLVSSCGSYSPRNGRACDGNRRMAEHGGGYRK